MVRRQSLLHRSSLQLCRLMISSIVGSMLLSRSNGFVISEFPRSCNRVSPLNDQTMLLSMTSNSASLCVDQLMEQVNRADSERSVIQELINSLSNASTTSSFDKSTSISFATTSNQGKETTVNRALFEPLLGYYNVSYTLTARPNDNPVGGKWAKLWKISRTLQHVLPVNESSDAVAQIVNAIRLDLFWGMCAVWVLLRGDAIPLTEDEAGTKAAETKDNTTNAKSPPLLPNLSQRTVRVYFDKPRIGLRLFRRDSNDQKVLFERVLSLGPTSSVVLDTPYVDDRLRLGKGGTSGSQFVFARIAENDTGGRDGWRWVLADSTRSTLSKAQLMVRVAALGVTAAFASRILHDTAFTWVARGLTIGSGLVLAWLALSTGGIETRNDTYTKGR